MVIYKGYKGYISPSFSSLPEIIKYLTTLTVLFMVRDCNLDLHDWSLRVPVSLSLSLSLSNTSHQLG